MLVRLILQKNLNQSKPHIMNSLGKLTFSKEFFMVEKNQVLQGFKFKLGKHKDKHKILSNWFLLLNIKVYKYTHTLFSENKPFTIWFFVLI